ncbi:MAG: PQQ-binding-like beta-propeller repeat protein [Planctomycetes bacterium]|nr:PQQ-binding-like beta-propeller repeat protein [Planctomycetota bacterium]
MLSRYYRRLFWKDRSGVFAVAMVIGLLLFAERSPAQWPQWGGPRVDFHADAQGLASHWPADGPRKVWSYDIGPGQSSVVVENGVVYTMYRIEDPGYEALLAVDAATGEYVFELQYAIPIWDNYDRSRGIGPRATPLILGPYTYSVGFTGVMYCFDPQERRFLWRHDLLINSGGTFLKFGFPSSPIVYKDLIIVQVGGKTAGFIAFKRTDQDMIWKAIMAEEPSGAVPPTIAWKSTPFENTYATPIVIGVDSDDQLVGIGADQVVAVSPSSGKPAWTFPHKSQSSGDILTPVWHKDKNLLFLPSDGTGKARMLRLTREKLGTTVEEAWASDDVKLGPGTVLRVGDYLYGSGIREGKPVISAVNATTGEVAWEHRGFSMATMVYGDDKLIIRDSDGVLALATVTPQKLTVHSQVKALGQAACSMPALVGNILFVRDDQKLLALDLN